MAAKDDVLAQHPEAVCKRIWDGYQIVGYAVYFPPDAVAKGHGRSAREAWNAALAKLFEPKETR